MNENFLESLRNRCPNIYTDYKNTFPKISIHIRRGDVNKDNYPKRYISNQYFLDHIVKIREVSPNARILIFNLQQRMFFNVVIIYCCFIINACLRC